jgi:hypothetical protein
MDDDPNHIDRLIDEGEDLTTEQAHGVGIDEALIKLASLSASQVHALEQFVLNIQEVSGRDKQYLREAVISMLMSIRLLREEVSALKWTVIGSRKSYRRQSYLIAAFCCVVLVTVGALRFNDLQIIVDPSDSVVMAIESSWWGFARKEREIRWMKTDEYDFPGWMAKGRDGKWYLYVHEGNFLAEE